MKHEEFNMRGCACCKMDILQVKGQALKGKVPETQPSSVALRKCGGRAPAMPWTCARKQGKIDRYIYDNRSRAGLSMRLSVLLASDWNMRACIVVHIRSKHVLRGRVNLYDFFRLLSSLKPSIEAGLAVRTTHRKLFFHWIILSIRPS